MGYSQAYLEEHRDEINKKRRELYQRQIVDEKYLERQAKVLEKRKMDKIECPHCKGVMYRKAYLRCHLITRHKYPADTLPTKSSDVIALFQ